MDTRLIALSVKSLEQQTKSVSLPRNATVLELKQKIQLVFDIDGTRQRLIFQGRVLKDDKNLLDYENLDDGKVIHLVVRPMNVPRNPNNDEPTTPRRHNIRASAREISNQYAVITVDATLDSLEDARTLMQSIMGNVTSGSTPDLSLFESPFSPRQEQRFPPRLLRTTSFLENRLDRRMFDRSRQSSRRPELDGLLDIIDQLPPIDLPVPTSLEMRLSRTLAYMTELRNIAEAEPESYIHTSSQVRHTSYRVIQESQQRLRTAGERQAQQVGYVVEELSELMELVAPQLSSMGSFLSAVGITNNQQLGLVHRASRMVQILSLIMHFLGSILSTAEPEIITSNAQPERRVPTYGRWPSPPPRNTTTTTTTTTTTPSSSTSDQQAPKRKHDDSDNNNNNNNNNAGSSSSHKKQRKE